MLFSARSSRSHWRKVNWMNEQKIGTETMDCPVCQRDREFEVFESIGTFLGEKYVHTKKSCSHCGTSSRYSSHWGKGAECWVVGTCTICGKSAAYNTPYIRSDNGELICNRCGDEGKPEDVVLIGVDQHLKNGNYVFKGRVTAYILNRNVIWIKPDGSFDSMWTHGGTHAFRLRDEEKSMDLLEVFDLMSMVAYDGHYRCSTCNQDFEGEPAGYPLFAGINCETCWQKHLGHLQKQRKEGKVCRMCGQPYGACCC